MIKVNFPGLIEEKLPSGTLRYRVRVKGNKRQRITLTVSPDEDEFQEHYLAARQGIQLERPKHKNIKAKENSFEWLCERYLIALDKKVQAKIASNHTLKQRKSLLTRLYPKYGKYKKEMPKTFVVRIRDDMAHTPGAADNMVKSLRAMYSWAISTGYCDVNPAENIEKLNRRPEGAKPWSLDDLLQFRQAHPPGTSAHLAITLFLFTACRISDAVLLGRENEFVKDGVRGIGWQPVKKGSAYVEIPMLPPLYNATRSSKIQGKTYLLTEHGRPFKSPESLRNRFKKWCIAAGLPDHSSHGVRKAVAHLLAHYGCSQYQIMTIQGHTQATTSEVYTKGVERWKLAEEAMDNLRTLKW